MFSIQELQKQGLAWKTMAHLTEPHDINGTLKPYVIKIEIALKNYPMISPFNFYFSDKKDFERFHNIFAVLGEKVYNNYLADAGSFPKETEQLVFAQKPTPILVTLKTIDVPENDYPFCKKLLMNALKANPNIVSLRLPKSLLMTNTPLKIKEDSFQSNLFFSAVFMGFAFIIAWTCTPLTMTGLLMLSTCFGVGCFSLTSALKNFSTNHDEEIKKEAIGKCQESNFIEEQKKALFFQQPKTAINTGETNQTEVQPHRSARVRLG
ncbi:MAG TPA: hypothetical protein VFP93_01360 [Gammaproteobacteria bacterium]|nr:hypothetical protein [Gammaproteobacteria bacterium]